MRSALRRHRLQQMLELFHAQLRVMDYSPRRYHMVRVVPWDGNEARQSTICLPSRAILKPAFSSALTRRLRWIPGIPGNSGCHLNSPRLTNGIRLHSSPKPVDFTAIAFRWFAFPHRFVMRHRSAFFR